MSCEKVSSRRLRSQPSAQFGSVVFGTFLFFHSSSVCSVFLKGRRRLHFGALESEQTPIDNSLPPIIRKRACLQEIKRLMIGDMCIVRGSRQRQLERSMWANDFQVEVFGRTALVVLAGKARQIDGAGLRVDATCFRETA